MRLPTFLAACVLLLGGIPPLSDEPLVINGKTLTTEERTMLGELARQYGVEVIPGRYWYDPRSGLYGAEGGPTVGQGLPGLNLGGPLREDASAGTSPVWVNGRRLSLAEVAYLNQCTPVIPGRYWLDAAGNGGVEGGPMQFNMVALCNAARQRSGSRFGSVLSDGTTSGAMFRNSNGTITSVTCGPDGGCIY